MQCRRIPPSFLLPCLSPRSSPPPKLARCLTTQASAPQPEPGSAQEPAGHSSAGHTQHEVAPISARDTPAWTPPSPAPIGRVQGKARYQNRIVPGQLDATLENHRAANRDSRLYRFSPVSTPSEATQLPRSPPSPVDRLIARLQNKSSLGEADVKAVDDELSQRRAPTAKAHKEPDVQPQPLTMEWQMSGSDQAHGRLGRPWLESLRASTESSIMETQLDQRMSQEIQAFANFMSPSRQQKYAALVLYRSVLDMIRNNIKNAKVEPHGSRTTSLANFDSDIDLCLTLDLFDQRPSNRRPNTTHPDAKRLGLRALRKLAQAVKSNSRLEFVNLIPHAQVPILELRDRWTGLTVQIAANASFLAVREMTRYCVQKHPHAQPIFLLLRQALAMRGLIKVSHGGIGSYSLFAMVITALNSPLAPFNMDLANSLKHVVKFWIKADLRRYGYMAEPFMAFSKWDALDVHTQFEQRLGKAKAFQEAPRSEGAATLIDANLTRVAIDKGVSPRKASQLAITMRFASLEKTSAGPISAHEGFLVLQDPANPTNDLGRKCTRIGQVIATLRAMAEALNDMIDKSYQDPRSQLSSTQGRSLYFEGGLLDTFVAGHWENYELKRGGLGNYRDPKPSLECRYQATAIPGLPSEKEAELLQRLNEEHYNALLADKGSSDYEVQAKNALDWNHDQFSDLTNNTAEIARPHVDTVADRLGERHTGTESSAGPFQTDPIKAEPVMSLWYQESILAPDANVRGLDLSSCNSVHDFIDDADDVDIITEVSTTPSHAQSKSHGYWFKLRNVRAGDPEYVEPDTDFNWRPNLNRRGWGTK